MWLFHQSYFHKDLQLGNKHLIKMNVFVSLPKWWSQHRDGQSFLVLLLLWMYLEGNRRGCLFPFGAIHSFRVTLHNNYLKNRPPDITYIRLF